MLSAEQERVVECIEEGNNVFFTGSAGTGKSTVLKAFVRRLKEQGKKVDIIAPSGIAAHNVGGRTIFNYASWIPDLFKQPITVLREKAHGKTVRRKLWKTDVLVVDEISMVERDLFVRLDAVMREAREGWLDNENPRRQRSAHDRHLPFGGCQVVVTGDFCQLPPVKPFQFCVQSGGDELRGRNSQDGRDLTCKRCGRTYADAGKWAFRCQQWEDCKFSYFELKHIHRQSDQEFINILQKVRFAKDLLPAEISVLTIPKADPTGAVKLLPRRREVEVENQREFDRLKSAQRDFECLDVFQWRNSNEPELRRFGNPKYADKPEGPLLALEDHRFAEKIELKVGMRVLLLVNLDFECGLPNGTQGEIVDFQPHDPNHEMVANNKDSSPTKSGKRTTEERMDFQTTQVRRFIARAKIEEWPVVKFHNEVTRAISAHCQLSELGIDEPYSIIGRTQIPLLGAWAITVHKSQGMTLARVIVDLYNSFEREMVYVALSRARDLKGLKVVRMAKDIDMGSQ